MVLEVFNLLITPGAVIDFISEHYPIRPLIWSSLFRILLVFISTTTSKNVTLN